MIFDESLDNFDGVRVGCHEHPYSCKEGVFGYAEQFIRNIEESFPGHEQEALLRLRPLLLGEEEIPDGPIEELVAVKCDKQLTIGVNVPFIR